MKKLSIISFFTIAMITTCAQGMEVGTHDLVFRPGALEQEKELSIVNTTVSLTNETDKLLVLESKDLPTIHKSLTPNETITIAGKSTIKSHPMLAYTANFNPINVYFNDKKRLTVTIALRKVFSGFTNKIDVELYLPEVYRTLSSKFVPIDFSKSPLNLNVKVIIKGEDLDDSLLEVSQSSS